MKHTVAFTLALAISGLSMSVLSDEELAPYGTAQMCKTQYTPQKIAFSVMSTAEDTKEIMKQLVGVLKQYSAGAPNGSQIEVVVIGGTVGAFAKENYLTFQPQIDAIVDMSKGKVPIKIALCGNSTKNAGYKYEDMHGFAEIVPAGYIEIAHAVSEGYAVAPINIVKTKDARYYFRPDLKPQTSGTPAAAPKM